VHEVQLCVVKHKKEVTMYMKYSSVVKYKKVYIVTSFFYISLHTALLHVHCHLFFFVSLHTAVLHVHCHLFFMFHYTQSCISCTLSPVFFYISLHTELYFMYIVTSLFIFHYTQLYFMYIVTSVCRET
jgi:hypothetical protein